MISRMKVFYWIKVYISVIDNNGYDLGMEFLYLERFEMKFFCII